MRITIELDDEFVRTARKLTGIGVEAALIRKALKVLIERESAHRLALLGGTMPRLKRVRRTRS